MLALEIMGRLNKLVPGLQFGMLMEDALAKIEIELVRLNTENQQLRDKLVEEDRV